MTCKYALHLSCPAKTRCWKAFPLPPPRPPAAVAAGACWNQPTRNEVVPSSSSGTLQGVEHSTPPFPEVIQQGGCVGNESCLQLKNEQKYTVIVSNPSSAVGYIPFLLFFEDNLLRRPTHSHVRTYVRTGLFPFNFAKGGFPLFIYLFFSLSLNAGTTGVK